MSRVGRTAEEVFCGVRSCPAVGTEVIWEPVHPQQEAVEGREEARAELGECRVVRAGEAEFLSCDRRCDRRNARVTASVWKKRMVYVYHPPCRGFYMADEEGLESISGRVGR